MKENPTKVHKKLIVWILIILLIPALTVYAIYTSLPSIIEMSAPSVANHFGIANFGIKIKKATWDDIDLRDLRIGAVTRRGVVIKKIKFLRSSSSANPNKILIEGATFRLDVRDGKVFIPGVIVSSSNPGPEETKPIVSLLKLPAMLTPMIKPSLECKIKDSELILTDSNADKESILKLPVKMALSVDKSGFFDLKIILELNDLHDIPFLPPGVSCKKMSFTINAEGSLHEKKSCRDMFAKFAIELKEITYLNKDQKGYLPKLTLNGTLWQEGDDLITKVFLEAFDAEFTSGKLKLSQINGKLPVLLSFNQHLNIPDVVDEEKGELNVGKITLDGKSYGKGKICYWQRDGKLVIHGEHSGLIPGNKAVVNGDVILPFSGKELTVLLNAIMDCRKTKIKMGEYIPKLKGMVFDGNANLKSDFKYKKGKLTLSAGIKIDNGKLEQVEKGLLVENINLDFFMPEVLSLKSASAQKISFDSLKLGELKFTDGTMQFQLESKKTFFLEKSAIGWCNGHIDFGAVRLNFDKPENIDFTFYCDRLNVAELLNQLQVAHGSGNGEVTGRIPLVFLDGHLAIKDGFLYSTPGDSATIKLLDFKGSDIADSNIQLAIARESLKDFKYKWIRLNLHTEDKSLLLKLELDGAPSDKLPFTFDLKQGLKKSNSPDQKAKFQGIAFELNYNIPIDDLIYYGRKSSGLFK